jgi:hypothetical protein
MLSPESLKKGVQLPKNIMHEDWLLNCETKLAPANCIAKGNIPKLS